MPGHMGGGYYPEMMYGDHGGDCGCGGGMQAGYPGGGCAGCGGGGFDASVMTMPTMTVPSPGPTPMPHGGTALPPPIPPAETSSVPPVPAGTQYVSVEEFQRLPGVVVSGPTPQPAAVPAPDIQALASTPAPAAQTNAAPLDTTVQPSTPSSVRQIQQATWAPAKR